MPQDQARVTSKQREPLRQQHDPVGLFRPQTPPKGFLVIPPNKTTPTPTPKLAVSFPRVKIEIYKK